MIAIQRFQMETVEITMPLVFDQDGEADTSSVNMVKQRYATFSDGTDMDYLQAVSDIDAIVIARRMMDDATCFAVAKAILRGEALANFTDQIEGTEQSNHAELLKQLAIFGETYYWNRNQRDHILSRMDKIDPIPKNNVRTIATLLRKWNRFIQYLPEGQDDILSESDLMRRLKMLMPEEWRNSAAIKLYFLTKESLRRRQRSNGEKQQGRGPTPDRSNKRRKTPSTGKISGGRDVECYHCKGPHYLTKCPTATKEDKKRLREKNTNKFGKNKSTN